MRSAARWYIDERNSRRVRHAQLRAPAGAPRHRLASCVEEALRLAALPGESEGRVYYFRRIRIVGLPVDGDRTAWLGLFQQALAEAAAAAVHGDGPRADAAEAVYFRSRQEALEILLRRVLAHCPLRDWFWPAVLTGSNPGPLPDPGVPAIVEALRMTPAGWAAVAAALFHGSASDAVDLLVAIPDSVAQSWLAEIDTGRPLPPHAEPANLPRAQSALQAVLRAFGFASPRTEWFAATAVLRDSPAELAAGALVERARLTLCSLMHKTAQSALPLPPQIPAPAIPAEVVSDTTGTAPPVANPQVADASTVPDAILPAAPPAITPPAQETPAGDGAPTTAGGLFFLLNALAHIGVPRAIAAGLAAANPDFLPRLLLRCTRLAAIPPADPVVAWLESQLDANWVCSANSSHPSWAPDDWTISRETLQTDRLIRLWTLAVRRWCWRMGRISVREIVNRPALFSTNRTDLDVFLPLDEADIRIRRIGLDLDPGWLPWFGWVVRFHYSYRGRLDA